MLNIQNAVWLRSLAASVTSTSTSTGTLIDLAPYINVGKRPCKFIVSVVDSTTTPSTANTIAVTWYESATTSSSDGTAITGAALAASTGGQSAEYNVLATKRYVFATAVAVAGATPVFGVTAGVIAVKRDF